TGAGPSVSNNAPGDPDLNTVLNGITSFDACVLEFDFLPAGDTIKFDYAFGSTEYQGFSCSSFNDVFGFFVSGPGITGSQNIALIPGTTIPICVNSTTGVTTGPQCTAMGAGSPFSQYYVNNNAGTTVTYAGFTTIFTAIKNVSPCSTYHLKLAIADGSDHILDSGVFLKAGSLTSNAVTVTPVGGGGLTAPVPYCVRGCLPGQFVFNRPLANPTPLTIHYIIGGTAVNGVDYTQIADSVVIPAGQTSTILNIFGLPANPPTGPVTVKLNILSPYACSAPVIIDSAELAIYDSIYVNILTPDTAICKYQSVDIDAEGDTLLAYSWTPVQWIDSANVQDPTVTPLTTTTYTIAATIPGSGCPPAHDHITITVKQEPDVDVGPDITTCLGVPIQFNTTVLPTTQSYTYNWSPPTYLSSTTIPDPIANPLADITYYVRVDPGAAGCYGYDTVNVHILPNDFTLFNTDTAICKGASVQINAIGDPAFTYTWNPGRWVSDSMIINPTITPDTSQFYTLTASYPSCPNIVKFLFIDVQPNPQVYVGPDREKCQWDTIQIHPVIVPEGYPNYAYNWTPGGGIDFPNSKNIVFSGQQDVKPLTLTLTTPAGCTGADDLDITVHQGNFATLVPADTGICPRDTVHLRSTGGVAFDWTPGLYLSDSTEQSPKAFPVTSIDYSMLATDQYGCTDTLTAHITVHPEAVLNLGDDVTIYPGESYQMSPTGNALYFQWFPPLGLSETDIANPVAMPNVNTRYFVQAATEWGCIALDSIDVNVNTESVLDVPNAFTPGSQPNNEIKIVKRGIATLKYFRIFNRWGAKVFETSNIDEGWNGTLNGAAQPMGVYVYVVEAVSSTGRRFYKQGNITLIR
ncbi:MAG: gliding motility-associated C-terminal domain-containing protein, partial [Sphingobacteriales bacterium]